MSGQVQAVWSKWIAAEPCVEGWVRSRLTRCCGVQAAAEAKQEEEPPAKRAKKAKKEKKAKKAKA